MALEELHLDHVPANYRVYLGLFKSVTNASHLQSQLVARNADYEYAFIDPSSVLSRLQLIGAVYKALSVLLDGNIKTPNVHSEIVCSLSPSNNVRMLPKRSKHALYRHWLTLCPPSILDLRGLSSMGYYGDNKGHCHRQGSLSNRDAL
jgi:hypothetical protein